ncbi:hypothetical protein K435DRAFT_854860 [Dendrothele bispora CBS 962.96]|uniref:Uncharacterized protein n=1 Tax=Dendrothele bispora (strain CBS 962.96) TaxID=1314807 RepID=A0A4S8MCX9_DENBC|nr:hypothetical protein K435DRAFT_854860 [Dendrothele bispora CBS 962.96]
MMRGATSTSSNLHSEGGKSGRVRDQVAVLTVTVAYFTATLMPRPIDIGGYSVIYLECSTVISDNCNSTPESGTNKISVDQNPQRYDSGRMFSINFAWNPHDPTAAENEALLCETYDLSADALAQILPDLPVQSSIVDVQTINSLLTITSVKPMRVFNFPSIPPDLRVIPEIYIDSLTCVKNLAPGVSLV